MKMHNPPHPGEFLNETYMEPMGLSCNFLAKQLGVSPSTLNRLLNKDSSLSTEMALRLSAALGRSPESWMNLQMTYSLWESKKKMKQSIKKVKKVTAQTIEKSNRLSKKTTQSKSNKNRVA